MGSRVRVCDAAVEVLRETDNPAVMWGDTGLLHLIAKRAGLPSRDRAWKTEEAVLRALSRQHGALKSGSTIVRRHRVRIFWLPERLADWSHLKWEGERGYGDR